jgi:transcriptional regulator with XRE-family HTH domain
MLSSIESGTANPSLDTLEYIAERLDTTVAHLLSDDIYDLSFEKTEVIDSIYRAYAGKNYNACIRLIRRLPSLDDELAFILASAYAELGYANITNGSLISAIKNLEEALASAKFSRLDTSAIEAKANMLLSIAKNVQSPLLEFDEAAYIDKINSSCDFELYKYISQDMNYKFLNVSYELHCKAKQQIKERNYTNAASLLLEAADKVKEDGYNAYVIFSIYTDLEYCYKQLYDYEKAYLYSTKRMTMLEGFKS